MKGILISLVVCVSFLFASNPVEPAKRTLFVYQHGLGNDSRGAVAKNCRMDAGSANATFDATGNHSFLIQEIANSWHHVYNQVLQHPGISPEVLKYEFGAIGYDAGHPKLQAWQASVALAMEIQGT